MIAVVIGLNKHVNKEMTVILMYLGLVVMKMIVAMKPIHVWTPPVQNVMVRGFSKDMKLHVVMNGVVLLIVLALLVPIISKGMSSMMNVVVRVVGVTMLVGNVKSILNTYVILS